MDFCSSRKRTNNNKNSAQFMNVNRIFILHRSHYCKFCYFLSSTLKFVQRKTMEVSTTTKIWTSGQREKQGINCVKSEKDRVDILNTLDDIYRVHKTVSMNYDA